MATFPGVILPGVVAAQSGVVVQLLPTVTSGTAKVIFGMQQMVAGYSGSLWRFKKSGGQTFDVGLLPMSNKPDIAAASTWAAGAEVRICAFYNQLTGAIGVDQTFGDAVPFDFADVYNGINPAQFIRDTGFTGGLTMAQFTVAGAANDLTAFQAIEPDSSIAANCYWTLWNNSTILWHGTDHTVRDGLGISTGTAAGTTIIPRAMPSVTGVRCNGSGTTLYARETSVTGSGVQPSTAYSNLFLNWHPGVNGPDGPHNGADGYFKFFGMALYTALNDADAAAVQEAMRQMFGFKRASDFNRRFIGDGDSIWQRYSTTKLNNIQHRLQAGGYILGNVEVFNNAIAGQAATNINGAKATRILPLLSGAPGKIVYHNEVGINDLRVNTSATTLANTNAAIASYVRANAPAGTKIGIQRVTPQVGTAGNGATDASVQTERTNYNPMLTVGATYDYVSDPVSDARIGAYPNNTAYYAQETDTAGNPINAYIHPNNAGAAIIAQLIGSDIQAALG